MNGSNRNITKLRDEFRKRKESDRLMNVEDCKSNTDALKKKGFVLKKNADCERKNEDDTNQIITTEARDTSHPPIDKAKAAKAEDQAAGRF